MSYVIRIPRIAAICCFPAFVFTSPANFSNIASLQPEVLYMTRALELAQKGKGHTSPNPMVGAVLVNEGRIIGEGWHHIYGQAHAEVDCLNNVAAADKHLIAGSTMYVTLEPCAHTGKTPPCADRLVVEKIGKVVIANKDPFELVSGRGIDILKNTGIDVVTGVCEAEGQWVNRRFFTFHQQKRPYIVLKWAQTTDGFIAPEDRSRSQITNGQSNRLVHKWRTEEAAIMVGATTAINDDPQLTARLWAGKQPLRIAISRNANIPSTHHLFDNSAETWIINEDKDDIINTVRYIQLSFGDQLLNEVMALLHQQKLTSLIVEGGAALLNSFINAGLWDEARVFTGNKEIGSGLTAPQLTNSTNTLTTHLNDDRLEVFVNKISPYPYTTGMEL